MGNAEHWEVGVTVCCRDFLDLLPLCQSFTMRLVVLAQVETIRAMWMFWPQQSKSWPALREKPKHPSFTWDTCQTSFSEPSENTPN